MLDANLIGNVNVNISKQNKVQNRVLKEIIYKELLEPLLYVSSYWHEFKVSIEPLLEHKVNQLEISKTPHWIIFNKIIEYNHNYVKRLFFGDLDEKYKQSSTRLIENCKKLEAYLWDEKEIDKSFSKININLKNDCDFIIEMLKNDFDFK